AVDLEDYDEEVAKALSLSNAQATSPGESSMVIGAIRGSVQAPDQGSDPPTDEENGLDAENAWRFVETEDIKAKGRHYLRERRSDKYKDAAFVYLDGSYCDQNHVNNKQNDEAEQGDTEQDIQSKNTILSQLSKHELYQRLQRMNVDVKLLNALERKQLCEMAKRQQYKVPLASDAIAQE
ncbi:hypothetical protein BGZ54_009468, partial [Gamsiella multidivaricata]